MFHDPGQALYREDVVAGLGLERFELFEDYRSPLPWPSWPPPSTADPASRSRWRRWPEPRIVEAEPGHPTVEAVRHELRRVLVDEGVRPWNVVVLSGASADKSVVWKERRFGTVVLWNGAIDDDGRSKGLPGEDVPAEPADDGVVLFETVRRFKGLERPVVILCELPAERDRLDQLLYTAFTRATTQLIVIAPPALAERLRRPAPRS